MGGVALNSFRGLLNIVSHTDLDGVVAAALAWRANSSGDPIKVSLTGYGEVDNLMLEAFRKSERLIALDLSPQFQATVDEIDRDFPEGGAPFLFDHHQSTFERYSNRPWIVVDMNRCGAAVYWDWLMDGNADDETLERIEPMRGMVSVANDRDLWINENPDGRLWQAMVTLCGEWGALARLITNPSASFTEPELAVVTKFIESQEKRFNRAREHLVRSPVRGLGESGELAFLGDGYLEFGDTSDFCGSILDRPEGGAAPLIAAISYRKPGGNWAVSLRSRGGLAGHVVSLLKDGRKIRGGGHGDAAALYFPSHYNEESIRESIAAALAAKSESSSGMGVTLGDLLKGTMQ